MLYPLGPWKTWNFSIVFFVALAVKLSSPRDTHTRPGVSGRACSPAVLVNTLGPNAARSRLRGRSPLNNGSWSVAVTELCLGCRQKQDWSMQGIKTFHMFLPTYKEQNTLADSKRCNCCSLSWRKGKRVRHFRFSRRPAPLLRVDIDALSRSWKGSVLSWVSVAFLSLLSDPDRILTKNWPKVGPMQGVWSGCVAWRRSVAEY